MVRSIGLCLVGLILILSGSTSFVSLPNLTPWLGTATSHARGSSAAPRAYSSVQTPIQLQLVANSFSRPVFVTNAKDGSNRLFIVEQDGVIKVLQPGSSTPTVFLDITGPVLSDPGEQGLLGLAFHPFYKNNGRFFVYYTNSNGDLRVAEYRVSADPNVANTTETVILDIPHPVQGNHNGGTIMFGPDGYLYIGPGDGGGGNDTANNAQNINSLLGKILRIDIDHANGAIPYSSPSTNPFFGPTAGADEIYARGLRNPYRFSFDRGTGLLYLGDVGQGAWEEIDVILLGGNYGWRAFEGMHCTGLDPGICTAGATNCNTNGFICPIGEYSLTGAPCAVTGGYVYRGPLGTLPTGTYIFSDYCTGDISTLNSGMPSSLLDTDRNITSFGEDEIGELYVVGHGGTLDRIVKSGSLCAFASAPTSQAFPATGGSGVVTVAATVDCGWSSVNTANWITINLGNGTGAGIVTYTVHANPGPTPRSANLTIAGLSFMVFQGVPFGDVSPAHPLHTEIGKLSARQITQGCGGGNFCPTANVTREQAAAFIIRALHPPGYSPPTNVPQRYNDVPPTHPFYGHIEEMAALGITLGCGGNNYCPTSLVTREQIAAFLIRALHPPGYVPPAPPSQRFVDVPPPHPFYGHIDELAIRGITAGCTSNSYCPTSPVTRQQIAAFLVRAFNL
jgi:glucose/arabinose dehydrogenase